MGLQYSYLLYFDRKDLWDVLKGLEQFCETNAKSATTIQFPDHDLVLPLESFGGAGNKHAYDRAAFGFSILMYFNEDQAIYDYCSSWGGYQNDRSPPDEGIRKVAIGTIYLTVYADLSMHFGFVNKPTDMVLFEFSTTGSKMSTLFYFSTSIRKTFINVLEKFNGLIGILDLEDDDNQLFWFKGRHLELILPNNFLLPEEIEQIVKQES